MVDECVLEVPNLSYYMLFGLNLARLEFVI
ncbi:predicted protein [Sclerotinia sclerotiorum 1980 UF-70]|uniref:Uncharacterized protein n=1 Tax=Sclerotinia sclerotiorum (strain ATCC 18683 / 1980 / Ss-1) TaxID=665079 RepID=A7ERJ2_SCLS1|nr:predicted protein [Sclerotinia sclerotiorum 1980 UF-70]EDN92084.1 predicted protein [Sclerotinia sclerotiorum 1980 UF-70]